MLHNALLRLLRALPEVKPACPRAFFGLAAKAIRRELLDLARHFSGPHGQATHPTDPLPRGDRQCAQAEVPDGEGPSELEVWSAFQEEVEQLPVAEREVVGLLFYHGWTQTEVADLFQVTERTVQRHWQSALTRLHRRLEGRRESARV